MLERASAVLESVQAYEGCQVIVQRAISAPTEENLAAAWSALAPAVAHLQDYYAYAKELEQAFPELMGSLCVGGSHNLAGMQALARQLGGLLDFVIRFDHAKMNTPAIQNDFSYYRRSMQRMKAHQQEVEEMLSDELANRMSLFYASHTPVMTTLVGAVMSYINAAPQGVTLDSMTSALSTMASSCRDMLKSKHFESQHTNLFCLRTMVASIILFDQLDATGAFHKKSPINVKSCVTVLREWNDTAERVSLANMLRFTSKHLKDDNTVAGISELLNEAAQGEPGAPSSPSHNNNNA